MTGSSRTEDPCLQAGLSRDEADRPPCLHLPPAHCAASLLQEDLNFLLTNRVPRIALTRFMGWFSQIRSPLAARAVDRRLAAVHRPRPERCQQQRFAACTTASRAS
jgi:hypothetical protein